MNWKERDHPQQFKEHTGSPPQNTHTPLPGFPRLPALLLTGAQDPRPPLGGCPQGWDREGDRDTHTTPGILPPGDRGAGGTSGLGFSSRLLRVGEEDGGR